MAVDVSVKHDAVTRMRPEGRGENKPNLEGGGGDVCCGVEELFYAAAVDSWSRGGGQKR